jgi:hypothetical protein
VICRLVRYEKPEADQQQAGKRHGLTESRSRVDAQQQGVSDGIGR